MPTMRQESCTKDLVFEKRRLEMKEVDEIVRRMSLDEKIALIAGSDAWHISGVPSAGLSPIMITDGPHGLRKQMEGSDNLGQ